MRPSRAAVCAWQIDDADMLILSPLDSNAKQWRICYCPVWGHPTLVHENTSSNALSGLVPDWSSQISEFNKVKTLEGNEREGVFGEYPTFY